MFKKVCLFSGNAHPQLAAAIDELEHSVSPQPATVAELHDHMRLRTLQLLAEQFRGNAQRG